MSSWVTMVFGEGRELEWWQMSSRAGVLFFVALGLIRVSGRRSFGMGSPFDNVVTILLGAILSRAVVGVSAPLPTVAACLTLVLLHRLVAWVCIRSTWANRIFKGSSIVLFEHGSIQQQNLDKSLICREDLEEGLRTEAHTERLDRIEKAVLERSGKISITKKG